MILDLLLIRVLGMSEKSNLNNIAVAIIEPTYPVNIGHLARLVMNFGASELLVVDPHYKLKEALPYSSHAADILCNAESISFNELTKKFDLLVGSSAILGGSRNIVRDAVSPEIAVERIGETKGNVCIVFGRETTGLTNYELSKCDIVITISTDSTYNTLNVAHSAAIILYMISRKKNHHEVTETPREIKERFIDYFIELAEISKFPKYKTRLLRDSVRRLIGRGNPTSREVYILMGALRKGIIAAKKSQGFSKT